MAQTLSAYRTFYQEFRRQFHTTGSIVPSGRFLAMALARFVKNDSGSSACPPRRILEVGPGSGSVTDSIVANLGADDRLDLVEVNSQFVELLERRFNNEPALKSAAERVRIFHRRVEEMMDQEPYDLIISGLPLNNFAVADVERILGVLSSLLKPGGRLSFFEYVAIRVLKTLVSRKSERERLRGIGKLLGDVLRRDEIYRDTVWLNFPPACVHHVDLNASRVT